MNFSLVVAVDENMGIGKNGELPWKIPGDLKYFAQVTSDADVDKKNVVIMGRKTWESIPKAHRPLKGRINIVLSRKNLELPDEVLLEHSFEDALNQAENLKNSDKIFVIGGGSVFKHALKQPSCNKLYITEVDGDFDCDVFFPRFDSDVFKKDSSSKTQKENGISYKFVIYKKLT